MVQMTEKGFIITFEYCIDPLTDLKMLHDQLIQMLQSDTEACMEERWHVLELLRHLIPDYNSPVIESLIKYYRVGNS